MPNDVSGEHAGVSIETTPVNEQPQQGIELRRIGGAAALMMAAVLGSRVIGYFRDAYIAFAFGAGTSTDAYVTAFTIPDWLNYLVAGGLLSTTFITVFSPFVANKREHEGYRVFSIVTNFLLVVLTIGIVVGELITPRLLALYVHNKFSPQEFAECVRMTRILLPAQLFFCVGGVIAATLYARGRFFLPAISPLIYNVGIILGGVLLSHWLGVEGLVIGAVAGAVVGPFLLPLVGAVRGGLRYSFVFNFRDAQFVRWLKLTLPLMIGVSLVSADQWIMRPLAASLVGAIFLLYTAKQLIGVPIAVLGQAVGQASMPFYSWLAAQNRWDEFRAMVDDSVSKTFAGALFATSWFAALSLPIVRLIYERGRFHDADARAAAVYFFIFVLSLGFWSIQGLYSRAFYAAGNTLTPMVAGTAIFLASLPVYVALRHQLGIAGLAVASDIGIVIHTLVLAWLLYRRNWMRMTRAHWIEMPRIALASLVAGGVTWYMVRVLETGHYHWAREIGVVAAASLVWLAIAALLARLLRLEMLLEQVRTIYKKVARRVPGLRTV